MSNRLRTLKFTVSIEQLGELYDADFDRKFEDKENVDAILEAAGMLNKKQYEVFVRFYLYGEPLTEIAERMGIGGPDARTTLFRTREAIRKYLSERGYFDD